MAASAGSSHKSTFLVGEVERLTRDLKAAGGQKLFVFLATNAAELEWKNFIDGMGCAAGLAKPEIEVMLRNIGANMSWSSAYARSEMPREFFPFFIKIVQLARSVTVEVPTLRPSSHVRITIVGKAYLAMNARTRGEYLQIRNDLMA